MISCNQNELPKFWYVLYTRPRKEKFVDKILRDLNFNSFLPMHRVIRQWSDRKKRLEVPIFNNYIFVKINKSERGKVCKIPGVVRILGNKNEHCIVPEHEIEIILKSVNFENIVVNPDKLREGEECLIQEGPFEGVKGIFIKSKGKNRLALHLKSIQRSIILDIDPSHVLKASSLSNY